MPTHRTDKIFFNDFTKNNADGANSVWELVKHCSNTDEVIEIIEDAGFEYLETIHHRNCTSYRYANPHRLVVETYFKGSYTVPLTVNVSTHSFGNADGLRKFHESWTEITSRSAIEMQD